MEKRRILDIKYPKITAYPHHAHIMAIIGEDEHKLSWFYNSYIQLQINKNGYNKMDFCVGYNINPILYNCPWITCHGISRTLLKKGWNSIIEFLIDSINDGYYIYIGVDEYYIPSYDSFNKQHSVHDMLVYGYDLSKEKFYIADFFKERKYNFALCDFKEMEKAHVQTDQSDSFNGVMLIKPKDYTYNYSFCIYTVKKLIKDYIECKNSNLRTIMLNTNSVYKDEYLYAYGLEVYKVLKTSLYTLTIKDIRPFYVLYEHKKIMKFLIKYLNDNGYLSKADKFYSIYEDLVCKTKILVNTMIKYFLTKSECIANHAIEILDNIYDIESNILYDLYNNIKELGRLDTVSNASLDCNSFYLKFYGQWNEDYVHSYTKKEKLIKQTEIKGSYVQCTFYGSYIAYIANKNKKCGYAKIEIDGIYYGIVDLYSEEEIDEIVFSTYKLVLGYHTLKITCLGEQNMYSQGSSINFKEIYTLCDNNKSVIETEVRFIKEDSITKGDWIGEYGVDGYDIPNFNKVLPSYADYIVVDAQVYIDNNKGNFESGLLISNKEVKKIVSCYYSEEFLDLDLIISGEQARNVQIYFLDADKTGIPVNISILDVDNKRTLYEHTLTCTMDGCYVEYEIRGHVVIRIRKETTPDFIENGGYYRRYGEFNGLFFGKK